MRKKERQNTLLSVIRTESISSQSALAEKLSENGFAVTQASVSRDLDELGVVKVDGYYSVPIPVSQGSVLGSVSYETAGDCLIVGRCSSGLASAITVRIDAAGIPEIVGTIAGDDTIFVAVKNAQSQSVVMEKIIALSD